MPAVGMPLFLLPVQMPKCLGCASMLPVGFYIAPLLISRYAYAAAKIQFIEPSAHHLLLFRLSRFLARMCNRFNLLSVMMISIIAVLLTFCSRALHFLLKHVFGCISFDNNL